MKKPCDKCKCPSTYYEYPCMKCINNPHTDDEILQNYREEINEPRFDKFKKEDSYNIKPCVYCTGEKLIDLIIGDTIEREVINVATSDYKYCPNCGGKIAKAKSLLRRK